MAISEVGGCGVSIEYRAETRTKGIQMSSVKQFNKLWKVGCRRAILQLIKNQGAPLSTGQLEQQIRASVRRGAVSHALLLAKLAGRSLTLNEASSLVLKCLENGWITDAIYVGEHCKISKTVKQRLPRFARDRGLVRQAGRR